MSLRILILAFLASSAMATTFSNCQNGPPPLALRLDGCDAQPCNVVPGTDVRAEVDFLSPTFVERLTAKVRATALNVTIDYPLPEPDACKTLINSACPLESGDTATYVLALHLIDFLPPGPVIVELRVINPDGVGPDGGEDILFCLRIQFEVISSTHIKIV